VGQVQDSGTPGRRLLASPSKESREDRGLCRGNQRALASTDDAGPRNDDQVVLRSFDFVAIRAARHQLQTSIENASKTNPAEDAAGIGAAPNLSGIAQKQVAENTEDASPDPFIAIPEDWWSDVQE
jgi:hypothetical protein